MSGPGPGGLPVGDWQFWVVTLIAGGSLLYVARLLVGLVRPPGRRRARANLTISAPVGRREDRPVGDVAKPPVNP